MPVIAGYRDLRLVGSGGFSKVYTAYQESFARTVAVKVVTVELSASALRRLSREQMTAGQLDGHPHVIRVYEAGTTEQGQPYMTMEHHEQGSYADRLRRQGPLPLAEVLDGGIKLASALDAAHRRGIVHRDVKPQNVLVSPIVGPVLSDFGIAVVDSARLAETSEAFTALHVAPEVLEGHPSSPISDLYSLASVLYELLAGAAPFAATEDTSLLELMRRVRSDPLPVVERSDVPPEVAQALAALLERSPERRPQTAAGLADRLRGMQQVLGWAPTPDPLEARTVAGHAVVGDPTLSPEHGGRGDTPWDPPSPERTPTPERPPSPDAPPVPSWAVAPSPSAEDSLTIDKPRPVEPPRPLIADEETSRWPQVSLVVGAVCLVVAVAAGGWWWFLRSGGDDDADTQTQPTNDPDPADEAEPLPPCPGPSGDLLPDHPLQPGEPPTVFDIELSGDGTAATLRWDDPSAGFSTYIVFLDCDGEAGEADGPTGDQGEGQQVAVRVTAPGEPTEATFDGLSLQLNYCYTVAVLEPDGSATPYAAADGSHFLCTDKTTR